MPRHSFLVEAQASTAKAREGGLRPRRASLRPATTTPMSRGILAVRMSQELAELGIRAAFFESEVMDIEK